MRRQGYVTEPISCDVSSAPPEVKAEETIFDKKRGVSVPTPLHGYCQAHVDGLEGDITLRRLDVLREITNGGISLDFLKLTPTGLSFLVPDADAAKLESVLKTLNVTTSIRSGRSIVMVHSVNIRDEEGLIASILNRAIESGVTIEHVGDMHDRLLLVVDRNDALRLAGALSK